MEPEKESMEANQLSAGPAWGWGWVRGDVFSNWAQSQQASSLGSAEAIQPDALGDPEESPTPHLCCPLIPEA